MAFASSEHVRHTRSANLSSYSSPCRSRARYAGGIVAGPFLQMPRRRPFFDLRGLVARAPPGSRCASPKLADSVLALGWVEVNEAVERQPQDRLSRTVFQLLPSDRRAARSRRSPRLRIVIITPARRGRGVAGHRGRRSGPAFGARPPFAPATTPPAPHIAVTPPSSTNSAPVMKVDSSEAR